jgi:uncharacterized protein YaaR (DUF327 family)
MDVTVAYNGSLTAEQFLFYEMRIVAKMYLEGKTFEEIIQIVKKDNLFQYPTEREVSRLARASCKRLVALGSKKLIEQIANEPNNIAKQINLYAMMRYNRLIWEFMINIIGEKYRTQDFSFSRQTLNVFFTRLQEENDNVASWSDKTIAKIKQVLVKSLVETEFLDSNKAKTLNRILLSEELEKGIRENKDYEVLAAFNCFK